MMTIEEIDRQIQELSSQEGYNSDLQFLLSQKTEVPNQQSKVQNKDKRSISNNLVSHTSNYSKMNNNNNYYYKQNINEKQNYKNLLNSRKTNYVSFKQKTNLTQKKNENTSQYSQKSHLSTNTNSNITTQKTYQNYNQINKNTLKNVLQPSQLNMKKPYTAKIQRPSQNPAHKQLTQTEKTNQNIEKKLKMYLYDNKKLNNFATLIQEKYQILKNHQQQLDSELNQNSEKQQALEKYVQNENQSQNILQTQLKNQNLNQKQNQNSNQKNQQIQKNQKEFKNYLSHNGLSNFINNLKFSNQFANSNNKNLNNNNNLNNKNNKNNNLNNNINNNINNNNKLLAIQHKRERSSTAQNFVKQNKTDKLAITSSNNNTISMFGNLGSCRYKIQTELGKGSYATCKLATDSETKQQVALKCYPRYILNDPIKLRNVKREISILSRINHPNIVQLFNSVEERSQIVLVLEFPCKQSIKNVYKSTAKRSDADLKYIMKQIIQALLYIHEQGIYHRDIKADNILIDEKNTIKIIDFGFAICPPQGQKLKIFCGTPQYMSPEIVNKTHYYGDKADIWAAGIVFYQMLFGQTPYKAFSDSELYQKIRKNKVVFPHPIQPDLKQLILNMLEKNPSQRFDAKQVLNSEYFQS